LQLDGIFADFLHRLQRGMHFANYQFCDGNYLVSIDGSQYFSSEKKEYWNQLRCTIRILIFPRWESLLQFILDPESGIPP